MDDRRDVQNRRKEMHKEKTLARKTHCRCGGEKRKQGVTVTAGCSENNGGHAADQLITGRYPVAADWLAGAKLSVKLDHTDQSDASELSAYRLFHSLAFSL